MWPVLPQNTPPDKIYNCFELKADPSIEVKSTSCNLTSENNLKFEPTSSFISSFSSLYKLKLATSWLVRFQRYLSFRVRNLKMSNNHTPISVTELNQAEFYLIKYEQCVHFDAEIACVKRRKYLPLRSPIRKLDVVLMSDISRIAGRLAKSVLFFDLKHPIVFPETSHLTYLIIRNTHVYLVGHSGVNTTLNCLCQRFWIVNARVAVQRVVSNCVTCRKTNSNLEHQYMADLPVARFQIHQPPFSHVGVNFFGPLLVKVKRSEVVTLHS